MTSLQEAKSVVLNYYDSLDSAQSDDELKLCFEKNTPRDYLWRGFYPFGEIKNRDLVILNFWKPFRNSFKCTQRRQDIFFAGKNSLKDEEGIWVVSMGHLLSLFDREWLGIQPNFKIVMLRYCEFNLVNNGQILQTAFYFDIPHLMSQANQDPFDSQTGSSIVQPGPRTHDGVLFEDANPEESKATLQLINMMISHLGQWENPLPLEEELALSWQDDMLWWGPHGIGSTFTIERYAKQHAGPFRAAFSDRSGTGHIARLAEGHYGGFFGWPNCEICLRPSKNFGSFSKLFVPVCASSFSALPMICLTPRKLLNFDNLLILSRKSGAAKSQKATWTIFQFFELVAI